MMMTWYGYIFHIIGHFCGLGGPVIEGIDGFSVISLDMVLKKQVSDHWNEMP